MTAVKIKFCRVSEIQVKILTKKSNKQFQLSDVSTDH